MLKNSKSKKDAAFTPNAVTLPILGMHSASCSQSVESALKNVRGVKDVAVDIDRESAQVSYDSDEISMSALIKAVERAGFFTRARIVKLPISGMHCAACVTGLTTVLSKTPGVLFATVHLPSESATIVYDNELIDITGIHSAISRAGFRVAYLLDNGSNTGSSEKSDTDRADTPSKQEGALSDLKADRAKNPSRRDFTLARIIVGILFSSLLMWLMMAMGDHAETTFLSFIIATPAMIWVGWPIFTESWRDLTHSRLTMEVMYAMGISVAYAGSVISMVHLIPDFSMSLFETTVMLAAFMLLGRFLEKRAKDKSNLAISALVSLQAQTALLVTDENPDGVEVPAEDIKAGDLVAVKTGLRFPCDGVIVSGSGSVSEAMITGEPMPIFKDVNDQVVGGTVLGTGSVVCRATATGSESVLAGIIRLIEDAQQTRPHVASLSDRVVSFFIPVVLGIAVLVSVFWYLKGMSLSFIATTFISVIVVACPCALGLAIPTAVTVGIGRGASFGIFIRNSCIFEVAHDISALLFDKTGTITTGKPRVVDTVTCCGNAERANLITYALESKTSHPSGDIIVSYLKEHLNAGSKTSDSVPIDSFEYRPGRGLTGVVDGESVCAGNADLVNELFGIDFFALYSFDEVRARIEVEQDQGHTVVFGGDEKNLVMFIVADTVREDAKQALSILRSMKISLMMVSGDSVRAVHAIGAQVGLSKDEVVGEVLPEGKVEAISCLQMGAIGKDEKNERNRVVFVGDGINDAPALRRSDCGIALGSGTDIAIAAGDLVLMRDDLLLIPAAMQLARKVMQRIHQNLFWACFYNALLIPLAAGSLYPALTFRPEYGAFAMVFSSISVLGLSLLLKWYTPPALKKKHATSDV